jgi:hypothetical protein
VYDWRQEPVARSRALYQRAASKGLPACRQAASALSRGRKPLSLPTSLGRGVTKLGRFRGQAWPLASESPLGDWW